MKSKTQAGFWNSIIGLFRPAGAAPDPAEASAAKRIETTARIDALMALPIKERSSVTVVGDDGVSGYNLPPKRTDEV